jgi:activator of 2-hydroxyglutaryl-CoA dehydratase
MAGMAAQKGVKINSMCTVFAESCESVEDVSLKEGDEVQLIV